MQEFNFILPHGLVGNDNTVYNRGIMRLATARDEITVTSDGRVQRNPAYGVLVCLSLVIINIGELKQITPEILEDLSVLDLAYLREFYNRINQNKNANISVECPHCQQQLELELNLAEKL